MLKKKLLVEHLSFAYHSKQILSNVSIRAYAGQIVSLIGPNGSGKSTLLRCMCRLLPIGQSVVSLDDVPLEYFSCRELSQKIAFLPQAQDSMPSLTVEEFVMLGRAPYHRSGWIACQEDKEKTDWAIDYMRLQHLRNRYVENLSGGERQRVRIAMTLAQNTQYILLDEPLTYMDMKHQQELLETICDLRDTFGKTIIAVFHDINHALEVSDWIYLLKNGALIASGDCNSVITEEMLHTVYEVRTHVCNMPCCKRNVVIPASIEKRAGVYKER
ncbi:MAG: ABC transporter ATP-binding protein [Treponema sp.]|nr:ABC transporter ATP-binding protein [Treponema sp.]